MPINSRLRHDTVGDVSKRPRDRVSTSAATVPRDHMPAPPFPAVAHSLGMGVFRRVAEDDMVVEDGSVQEAGSYEMDAHGVVVSMRMAALTPTPVGSVIPSRSPSPHRDSPHMNEYSTQASAMGHESPRAREWGASLARKQGGVVTIGVK